MVDRMELEGRRVTVLGQRDGDISYSGYFIGFGISVVPLRATAGTQESVALILTVSGSMKMARVEDVIFPDFADPAMRVTNKVPFEKEEE